MKSSKLRVQLAVAQLYANESHATRLKVGAVLVRDGRPISVGYNGTPPGYDNTCEVDGETKPQVCHAELNCIAFAASEGTATKDAILVTTDSPCYDCAKLIIESKIKEVYYGKQYRDTRPLDFLRECNVKVERIEL